MTAVVITHPVTYGGQSLQTIQPSKTPVELPAELAAVVISNGLGHEYIPPPAKTTKA